MFLKLNKNIRIYFFETLINQTKELIQNAY